MHLPDLRNHAQCGKCDDVTQAYYDFLRSSGMNARSAGSPDRFIFTTSSSDPRAGTTSEETSSLSVRPTTKRSIEENVLPYWNTSVRVVPMSCPTSGRG